MTPDKGLPPGVRFRGCLDDVAAYKPGRPPATSDGRPSYKLSSNENPYPPLPGVLAAATDAAQHMNRYPDMGAVDLLEALSERLEVPTDDIAVATGSVALLYHLLQAAVTHGDEVVYAWRSFEAYPIAVQLTGATSVQVPLTEDHRHDFKAMEAAITDRTKVVLVCTPNNPTGPVVHRDELLAFVEAVPSNVLIVLDEAYREFVRDPEVVDGVEVYRDHPNVVVLRTFSKAYGLAGFRVGYAVGHPPVVGAIRKCALPFGVSFVAQAAAIASLQAEDELLARVEDLVTERTRVVETLQASGWRVPDTQTNFVWLDLGEATVEFTAAVQAVGVSIRPFPGDGVRVSIGEREANDLFLEVACAWKSP
ncbi:histidinol-phosphate transaminase [Kribbella sp. NPDC056951]|uniref:histidinol-phosphate transaminase n=1 Tax=Kribbella sp. NPDC056951 TaxID=3345978 RepID=UPI003641DC18